MIVQRFPAANLYLPIGDNINPTTTDKIVQNLRQKTAETSTSLLIRSNLSLGATSKGEWIGKAAIMGASRLKPRKAARRQDS